MKKLLLVLLFVPFVSFGQTYEYSNSKRVKVEVVNPKKTRREIQNEKTAAREKRAKDLKAVLAAEQRAINRTKTDFKYYNSGLTKGKAKDYKGAINDLTKFISKYPKNPKGWSERGLYKTWLDDASAACFDFKRGAELGSERAQKNLFKFCNSDGSVKEQKTYLDWNSDGITKLKLKDYSGAIEDFNKAIELGSDIPNLYINRANSKNKLKDYSGTIADLNKAIELQDEPPAYVYYRRGSAKTKIKDNYGAIADYNKAIELQDEPSANYYNQRAATKRESGDPKGAIEDYNKGIAIDPNGTTLWGGRGTAKSYLKDMDGACADWNKAVTTGDNKVAHKAYQEKIDENCLGMTKEKAIAKLKELKELLDLEVITQKDYDKEKAILTPIILGKN